MQKYENLKVGGGHDRPVLAVYLAAASVPLLQQQDPAHEPSELHPKLFEEIASLWLSFRDSLITLLHLMPDSR